MRFLVVPRFPQTHLVIVIDDNVSCDRTLSSHRTVTYKTGPTRNERRLVDDEVTYPKPSDPATQTSEVQSKWKTVLLPLRSFTKRYTSWVTRSNTGPSTV